MAALFLDNRIQSIMLKLRLPLDVATYGGALIGERDLAGESCVDGGAKVFSSDWNPVAGAAGIELASKDELEAGVEKEEIWCAGGLVSAGHDLRLVIQIREGKAQRLGLLFEFAGTVVGVRGRVVAAYGDDGDGLAGIVLAESGESFLDVLDVR